MGYNALQKKILIIECLVPFCVNITPLYNPMMVNWSIVHGKALQRSHGPGPGQSYISNRTFSSFSVGNLFSSVQQCAITIAEKLN